MKPPPPERRRILILYAKSGGGHRSAAQAVVEALELTYRNWVEACMVDFFTYAPPGIRSLPHLYPGMIRRPQAWGLAYRLTDGQRRTRLIHGLTWPYVRDNTRHLLAQHPSDLIVSFHPLITAPALRALGSPRPPFVVVVTDLATTHAWWYHRDADLCLVPTELAEQRALDCGLGSTRVLVTGLPVSARFQRPGVNRRALRARLGWPVQQTVVLLVGGSEGVGLLEETASAIAQAGLEVTLAVIAGRNQAVQRRLETRGWPIPAFIYGFVHEMPDFMRAADILVTKAGPSTISEAFIVGLPIVLFDCIPGQEDGNVQYVVRHGAGAWAPHPDQVVAVLRDWLSDPERRRQAAAASKRLARPEAAGQIADLLAAHLRVELPL